MNVRTIEDVLRWIVELRDKLCPTTSYNREARSNRILIEMGAGFGSKSTFFSRFSEDFELLVSIEEDEAFYKCLKNNVEVCNKSKYVEVVHSRALSWLTTNYNTTKYSKSLVYIDVERCCSLFNDQYMLFDNVRLVDVCSDLLSGKPINGSEPIHCPMVIVQFPRNESSNVISDLCENNTYTRHSFSDFILVALTPNVKKISASQRSKQRNDTSIPTVQDLIQFKTIWDSREDYRARIIQFIRGKLKFDFHMGERDQDTILRKLDDLILDNNKDTYVYQKLHDMLFKYSRKHERVGQGQGRSDNRVGEIVDLIPTDCNVTSLVDVGCAEGSITASLGASLKIQPSNIHGCDVRNVAAQEGFTFSRIDEDGGTLPYQSESHPLVVCLMVLHHIPNPSQTLMEIYRILKPGGYLLVREHDCQPEGLAMVLDVVHGLYSLSLKNPIEDPSFCDSYFAKYMTRKECMDMVMTNGFEHVPLKNEEVLDSKPVYNSRYREQKIKNPQRFYYVLFRKPEQKKRALEEHEDDVDHKKQKLN
ncbi:ubiG [Acrasis kona]|uniref:UbiG n=1 Tax=Acrasis kona TaxID=1008807 RepID=A0AAW2YGQ1_9EUKA